MTRPYSNNRLALVSVWCTLLVIPTPLWGAWYNLASAYTLEQQDFRQNSIWEFGEEQIRERDDAYEHA